MGLINGDMSVGGGACIRVGDRDRAKPLARNFMWRLAWLPLWIPKLHVFIGITMGPTIDRDRENILGYIEAGRAQQFVEYRANLAFKVLQR